MGTQKLIPIKKKGGQDTGIRLKKKKSPIDWKKTQTCRVWKKGYSCLLLI